MRMVIWDDADGYKHRSAVRDFDSDELAMHGISQDPPTIEDLDWEAIKRDLHNSLVNRGLFDYKDLIRTQNGVTGAIMSALRGRLIELYKRRR